ncbi:MAG: nitroreductase family protein [Oscillospiraceae bacterium]|nr:nitroreductase family protein [Oscillospiraceae bacterium]
MNETIKAIMERNSCRDFTGAPLTDEQMKIIIDAALAAPSAMNRQPWKLIVVKDKAFVEELDAAGMEVIAANADKAMMERMKERGGKLYYNAPCLVYILSDGSAYGSMDCGILCENIAIAAQALGLSTCIVGMANMPLTGPRGDEFKKRLGFPEGYVFGIGILVGAPNKGKEPHELDYGKVTYIG